MTVQTKNLRTPPRLSEENLKASSGIVPEVESVEAVTPSGQSESSWLSRVLPKFGGGKRLQNLAVWSRQLFVLVKSGTPLAQAMLAVERQAGKGEWTEVLKDLRMQIDEGVSLSEAMERHPLQFSAISRSLIAAGESSGQLHTMLERLSVLSRGQLRVRRSLIGSMVYPALLVVVAIVVVSAMIGFVLPRFEGLFETLDAPLPPSTKILMSCSEVFRSHWWAVGIGVISLVVGARIFAVTDGGKRCIDRWLVRLPQLGRIIRSFETARITRLIGSLVQSKVPLLDALQLTERSTTNSVYADLIKDSTNAVIQGNSISSVFAKSSLITPSVTEALRHGEASGQIGPLLTDMADFMDEENEVIVRTLTTIVEPLILIGLGVVVAFIAVSMFLPLFDITSMT